MDLHVGQTFRWERTFTHHDVAQFAALSGDKGVHHMQPDASGRVMVHGLLTATVPTKLGGDLNYIARVMTFEFVRPVYVGDTVQAELTLTQVEANERYYDVSMVVVCENQRREEVLRGKSHGVVRLR